MGTLLLLILLAHRIISSLDSHTRYVCYETFQPISDKEGGKDKDKCTAVSFWRLRRRHINYHGGSYGGVDAVRDWVDRKKERKTINRYMDGKRRAERKKKR